MSLSNTGEQVSAVGTDVVPLLIALEFAETCDLLAYIKPLFTVAVLIVMLILLELALICYASEVN